MSTTGPRLTTRQWRALRWAVREAAGWRGSLVGNPDPHPLVEFDALVATAKAALKSLEEQSRAGQPRKGSMP